MIDFTTRMDGEVEMICINDGASYYEIPNTEKASLTSDYVYKKLVRVKDTEMAMAFHLLNKEEVYVAGNLVRTDVRVSLDEASPILEELVENFPQYTLEELRSSPNNLVGRFGSYRPPYTNNSISYYNFESPSSALLDAYGCRDTYQDITNPWYGLKHDLVTKEIHLKVGFRAQDYKTFFNNPPEQPADNHSDVFSRLHSKSTGASDWVDMYLYCDQEVMKRYCDQINKPFPLPENSTKECWSYCLVFNDSTGEIDTVKGYVKYG